MITEKLGHVGTTEKFHSYKNTENEAKKESPWTIFNQSTESMRTQLDTRS